MIAMRGSAEAWRRLCLLLHNARHEPFFPHALEYALASLTHYHDHEREYFGAFRERLYQGIPQAIAPLFRSLFEHNQTSEGVSRIENLWVNPDLSYVRVISLSNYPEPDALTEMLLDSPHLDQIEHLSLGFARLQPKHIAHMARAPWFGGLRTIKFSYNRHLDARVFSSLWSRELPALEHLELAHCPIGGGDPDLLRHAPSLPRLRTLNLRDAELLDHDLIALSYSPLLSGLEDLDLADNPFGAAGLQALTAHPGPLRHLNLGDNTHLRHALHALAHSPMAEHLTSLDLNFCGLDSRDLLLLDGPLTSGLEALILTGNNLDTSGVHMLAHDADLGHLRRLELGRMHLKASALQSLFSSPNLTALETLDLEDAHASASTLETLALHHERFPHLTQLWLPEARVDDLGLSNLAASPLLSHITHLNLRGNRVSSQGVQALLASPYLKRLRRLELGNNPLHDQDIEALLTADNLPQLELLELPYSGHAESRLRQLEGHHAHRFPPLRVDWY